MRPPKPSPTKRQRRPKLCFLKTDQPTTKPMQIETWNNEIHHDLHRLLLDDLERRKRLLTIRGRTIVLLHRQHEYPIHADRCATHERITWWLSQLVVKTWVTKDHLREFIDAACLLNGLAAQGHV